MSIPNQRKLYNVKLAQFRLKCKYMKYNKLVRDKIPEYIESKGQKALYHVADEKEYWEKLKEKLQEEVKEFLEAESIEEMADIWEVIEAVVGFKKFDHQELQNIKNEKAEKRGKFQKRIILDES